MKKSYYFILPALLLSLILVISCTKKEEEVDLDTNTSNNSTNSSIILPARDIYTVIQSVYFDNSKISLSGNNIVITSNGEPNHNSPYFGTGDARYEAFNGTGTFKKNPNEISTNSFTFTIPRYPEIASTHSATSLGVMGFAINGVPLFNQYAGPNEQELTSEINSFDQYEGHPTGSDIYHYHVEPVYLTQTYATDSSIVGFLLDGFPVYGPMENGAIVTNNDLDDYHGHVHATTEFPDSIYHYHITSEAPYINGDGYYGTKGTSTN
ncbi:MAG: YHYH protein [Cyclobacteriaceae bacterium]